MKTTIIFPIDPHFSMGISMIFTTIFSFFGATEKSCEYPGGPPSCHRVYLALSMAAVEDYPAWSTYQKRWKYPPFFMGKSTN
jgi:hypothetical protein